ncbi:hypothetical protein HDZ31DRAFT_59464 [Schizophyllum fasciatum]
MHFSLAVLAIVPALLTGLAAAEDQAAEAGDPTNPQNLINCPPNGLADNCHLETSCKRIRLNYGYSFNGHYIWYNYNINSVPDGKRVEIDNQGTC